MAHSYMVFDFGKNEEAAQQARHRIDAWKQGYRLGNKLQLKFDREENETEGTAEEKSAKSKKKAAAKEEGGEERVRVLVRLDFSDHEKLSHQRISIRTGLRKQQSPEAKRSMRCTINARCLFGWSFASSKDKADGVSEPLTGTARSPAGLSRTTTASSS